MAKLSIVQSKVSLSVSGPSQVTSLDKVLEYIVKEKLEKTIILNNSSETIDYSFVDNPKIFIFDSENNFKVRMLWTPTDASLTQQTIEYEVEDLFVFTPSATFLSELDSLEIFEEDEVDVAVNVRVFGIESESV